MKSLFILASLAWVLMANDTNSSKDINKSESNSTLNQNILKQIEKEKKYKKEQKFYMGKDYNLSEHKVDPNIVKKVPVIEPEYDFDIDDLYSD